MMDNTITNRIDEKLPINRVVSLGVQHALALYAGTIAVPLVIGKSLGLNPQQLSMLIAAGIFTSGIATLIHNFGITKFIGVRLPVMMGCAFALVGACIAVGKASGLTVMYGSIIGMGMVMFLLAPVIGRLLRFFPHVVTGSIVTIIGMSLLPKALISAGGGDIKNPSFGDPKNLILALLVIAVIVLANRFLKGYMRTISILLGLFVGTIVAGFMGMLDFSQIASAKWVQIVTPFSFGMPKFEVGGILTLSIIGIVQLAESVGVFSGVGKICEVEVPRKQLIAGLRGEGIANIIGGILNSFPFITYSQNIGLLSLTKVVSRYVTIAAGIILIVLGCIPKFAAIATLIPTAVFGGAMIVMFSMVAIAGINMLREVDLSEPGNMLTTALAIGLGVGTTLVPQIFQHSPKIIVDVFGHSGIVTGALIAIVCNIIFNGVKPETNKNTVNVDSVQLDSQE